jgi:steroid delta-isomerase-like uncharacterized protein
MSADNKMLISRLYEEVWNKRKFDVVGEIISPSHALQGPNFSGSSIGPEAYRHQVALFLAGIPDLRFSVEDTVSEGDKIVACWSISGTHLGEFMGIPATNRKVSFDGMTIHHIAGGKIIDSFSNWDALGLMRQLGVTPALPAAKSLTAR